MILRWLLLMPRFAVVVIDPYGDVEAQARVACSADPLTAYIVTIADKPVPRDADLYQAFLKDRYAYTIGALNAAYGTDATSFTDLLTYDWRTVDPKRTAKDDAEFAAQVRGAAVERAASALGRCRVE